MNESSKNWYALKIFTDRSFILRYFDSKDIEVYIPVLNGQYALGSIIFILCTEEQILKAKTDWFHSIMVYRDMETNKPQAIPIAEMDNFKMVMNIRNQEFQAIELTDTKLTEGQKVRVLDGPLKGIVGVIKRIKGDRRLVVSVSGVAAVATVFVHPDYLEKVD